VLKAAPVGTGLPINNFQVLTDAGRNKDSEALKFGSSKLLTANFWGSNKYRQTFHKDITLQDVALITSRYSETRRAVAALASQQSIFLPENAP